MKKIISAILVLVMIFTLTACTSSNPSGSEAPNPGNTGSSGNENPGTNELPAINKINFGTDYQDITANIKILTNRTDIVDTVYKDYAEQFHKLYPNITVTYEGITDYEESLRLRLTTGDWGDICFIPSSVTKADMSRYFIPLGNQADLDPIYNFMSDKAYDGVVYGIPNGGNAEGIAYNTKVWADAGITKLPGTPDEFLADLQTIKDKTDAIPMYTNFAAGWTMGAWDSYIWGSATGDGDFHSNIVHTANPFSNRGDQTGPYAVYYTLYEAVARKLVEVDPMSTDWEGCKGMINRGEIGAIVLGSWSVQQFKDAGPNPDDVSYMPFPITVNGRRYATASSNYAYGINVNATLDNQIASMLYVKWLIDESSIFVDEACIPARKDGEMPAFLADFEGVELVANNPAPAGEEDLFDKLNNESEVGLNSDDYPDAHIVEAALTGSETLDQIMDDWNAKWSRAQNSLGVEVNQ